MIILIFFDDYFNDYFIIIRIILIFLIQNVQRKMCNVNDSPVLAFASLCYLKTPVVRPALLAKVSTDLLNSSKQGASRALQCRR